MIQNIHVSLARIHNQVGKSLLVTFAWRVTQAISILTGKKQKKNQYLGQQGYL